MKELKNPIDRFIWMVGNEHYANYSDAMGDKLTDLAEKEMELNDKAAEMSDIIEDYARYNDLKGYVQGLQDAFRLIRTEGLDRFKDYMHKMENELQKMIDAGENYD